ncbi:unnamed protein product [Thelazia callipaeda]|uniref:Ovule protein n=1 Tax=Thelazia callipaeda TaxID=103827 RepID=A0A0N5D9U0_THECL|nr:unnamed protein product [Thelazia callipaeda]
MKSRELAKSTTSMIPNSLVVPIPLKPKPYFIPSTSISVPAMYGFYASTEVILNSLSAAMPFTFGIF